MYSTFSKPKPHQVPLTLPPAGYNGILPGELFTRLRDNALNFLDYWNDHEPVAKSLFELTKLAYAYGFSDYHVITLLSRFQVRHQRHFDQEEWEKSIKRSARNEAEPIACRVRFEAYRDSVIAIESDPGHPMYLSLWLSYILDSPGPTCIRTITNCSADERRSALQPLVEAGKLDPVGDGALKGWWNTFYWNKLDPVDEAGFINPIGWNEDTGWYGPLEMCATEVKWHEETVYDSVEIMCFDIRTGRHVKVIYDEGQTFTLDQMDGYQKLVDVSGEVFIRLSASPFALSFSECADWAGITYLNGNPLDCRKNNLTEKLPA